MNIDTRPCQFCERSVPVNEYCGCPESETLRRATEERSVLKERRGPDSAYTPPAWLGESLVIRTAADDRVRDLADQAERIRERATSPYAPLTQSLSEAIVLLTRAAELMLATTGSPPALGSDLSDLEELRARYERLAQVARILVDSVPGGAWLFGGGSPVTVPYGVIRELRRALASEEKQTT